MTDYQPGDLVHDAAGDIGAVLAISDKGRVIVRYVDEAAVHESELTRVDPATITDTKYLRLAQHAKDDQ